MKEKKDGRGIKRVKEGWKDRKAEDRREKDISMENEWKDGRRTKKTRKKGVRRMER